MLPFAMIQLYAKANADYEIDLSKSRSVECIPIQDIGPVFARGVTAEGVSKMLRTTSHH